MSIALPPDREWLTAAEAAAEALPGFSHGERTLRTMLADSEIVSRRQAGGPGRKGREFHWTSLPPAARDEYLKRYGIESEETDRNEGALVKAARRDLKAEARALIVQAAQSFIGDMRLPVGKGLQTFCSRYAKRRTKLDAWVYTAEPALAPAMLRAWQRAIAKGGAGALIDRRGRPPGSGIIHDDEILRGFIVSQYAARPQLTARQLCDAVATDLNRSVSLRTMQAFLASFRAEHAPTLKALTNPDQHRSHHKPAFGSLSASVERINQRWELDATRADAMCLLPDGSRRRFAITGLIDVRTRRAMMLVSEQPRGLATQALLRRAILTWGLPEILKTDNGKEFVNRAVMRFCEDLRIEVQLSRVFTPEQKGHVERMFGTMNRGLFKLLPGFVGHNIVERKGIEARASFAHRFGEIAELAFETSLSPAGLQARIDAWLADVYEQAVHSELQAAPAAVALSLAGDVRRLTDERALDALLMDAPDASGVRTVLKRGIRVASCWFIAPELGALMGSRVHVRLDPADASRIVVYTHDRSRFVCIAESVDAMENARRMQIAREAQAIQRKGLRLIRTDVMKVQRQFPATGLADRLLTDAGGDGFVLADDARDAMQTAARPRLVVSRAALDGLEQSKAGPQPKEPTADELANAAAYVADMTARLPAPARMVQCDGYGRPDFLDDDLGFYAWAMARRAAGEPLDQVDAGLFAELAASPAFQQQLVNAGGK